MEIVDEVVVNVYDGVEKTTNAVSITYLEEVQQIMDFSMQENDVVVDYVVDFEAVEKT